MRAVLSLRATDHPNWSATEASGAVSFRSKALAGAVKARRMKSGKLAVLPIFFRLVP